MFQQKKFKKVVVLIIFFYLLFINQCNKEEKIQMNTLTIHYHRYDNKYDDWTLWTWLDHFNIEVNAAKKETFGLIFILDMKKYPTRGNISFIPKYKNWERKDAPDRIWNRSEPTEIWILQGNGTVFTELPNTKPSVRKAFIDGPDKINVILTHNIKKEEIPQLFPIIYFNNGDYIKPSNISLIPENSDSSNILQLITPNRIDLNLLPGEIKIKGFLPGKLYIRRILDSPEYITDEALGISYTSDETKFSVFAPGATSVTLHLYQKAESGKPDLFQLTKGSQGIWKITIPINLVGKYYTYTVNGPDPSYDPKAEVIDPYTRCVTAHNGRGLIIDDNTPIADSPIFTFQDAVIYEVHIRDFTIGENSGAKHKGKYIGFFEENTTIPGTKISTALNHLIDLGVNTIQLMPVQDFENDEFSEKYFWGYMPVNFNSPDGWFASNPLNDSRVYEFKKLVDSFHKHGIKVVMDVVYNHTSETNSAIRYNFNGFVPNFYYREKLDGSYWNGSGCGNEVRTENPMVRRFIVESLKYWVETYKIDGFRFDLMGLIDIETMQEIVKDLKAINPNIFIYGEPWTSGETPIQPTIKGTQRGEGFAVFNDNFRDALKGPWYNIAPGYIQTGKNVEAVKRGIKGSITDFADSPLEVINYVACHDGRTLWDQLKVSTENDTTVNEEELRSMNKLAAAILLTSQGIPFIHGGQEFLRSKQGSHNSYNQPDEINKIRWELKQENRDIFEYYKGLIKLRKEHPIFRMTNVEDIEKNLIFFVDIGLIVPNNCIAYKLQRDNSSDKWKEVLVLINPNRNVETFQIPRKKWILVVDDSTAGTDIIKPISESSVSVNPISAMVMYR